MMKKVFITALAVMAALSAMAQQGTAEPRQTLELTLDQAIELALTDNPTMKVADLEIERQDYVRKETVGNLLPNLSATGSYNRTIIQQSMSRDGLSFGADNTITGTATLTVPLFAPAVYANLKLNRMEMENAVEAARASKITMVNEVRKAYYNILVGEQSLEVLNESAEMIQKSVDNVEAMFESGLAAEYDLITAQVQLSNLQPTIIQTRSSIDIAKMMLKMYLSIPQEYDINVVGKLDDFSDMMMSDNSMYTTDVTYNSDLRTLDIQERMLNQQIKLINSQRMPTIAAFGSFTITGNDMGDIDFLGSSGGGGMFIPNPGDYASFTPTQVNDMTKFLMNAMGALMGSSSNTEPATGFWWQNPASAGIQISIPIFSGNKINNQVKQTRNMLKQLNLQRNYLEQGVKMQAQSAINNIITAKEKLYANEKTVSQAKKAYDIADARYQAGIGTMLELNSSQLSLTQAQLNFSQAIYEYLAAEADYDVAIGKEYWNDNN